TQAGVACTFSANPPSLTLAANAQSAQLALTAVSGCTFTPRSSAPWLPVAPASATVSTTLTIGLSANTVAASRTGAITIGGLTIPVVQAGTVEVATVAPPPANPCAGIRLQRDGDQMPAAGLSGDSAVAVLADSVCAWNSQSTAPWLTVTAGGAATGNGTLKYSVQPNPDPALRIGNINVAGKLFTVTQAGSDVQTRDNGNDSGGDSSGGGGGGSGGGDGGGSSGGSSG
ncbi:MAG: BACON domain-containing carbohydrate-binding protein, partial [Betaproteobacteria bacterium]